MPSRKQRRRREKLQRHEYEYYYETEEGEEIPAETPREQTGQKKTRGERPILDRRGRPVQKPSVQRVLKRGAIFGPILIVLVWVTTSSEVSTQAKILNAILLLMVFLPFSYLVDTLIYRVLTHRQRRGG